MFRKFNFGSFWSKRLIYTFASSSQSNKAVCFSLLELSILYLLHRASRLLEDPGNLSLAKTTVSIISLLINSLPAIFNSLFKCDKSNSAL